MDIREFLTARLDEEEAEARQALALWPHSHFTIDPGSIVLVSFHRRHDPARVLAETKAKRRRLDLHRPDPEWISRPRCLVCLSDRAGSLSDDWQPDKWPCETLLLDAAPYADHPDYDPAWTTDD